ncbi:MAG TPA: hypothetical protein PKJ08_03805 [Candidatus Cloacimonadota bacterium]|jgi:cyanate lyase|nr:hypothetical protein [Candidatus Cloacimonadota bacterium]HPM00637.1 hypothetical protein [Candidatus Cloacimonadota bacterium]
MKAITLDKVETGMKLAQDVLTSKGQVLLKSGLELDAYYIGILNKYNIDVIVVSSEDEQREMSPEEKSALLMQIRPVKKMIFQKCIDDPMMYEMYEAIIQNALWEKWNEK